MHVEMSDKQGCAFASWRKQHLQRIVLAELAAAEQPGRAGGTRLLLAVAP